MNIIPINYYLLTNFAKQNVGVPVYTWNGNGYTQSHYQQASKLDEYIHWIVGIDVVDGLRPVGRCSCLTRSGQCVAGDCTGYSNSECGFCGVRFWNTCAGMCMGKIIITSAF